MPALLSLTPWKELLEITEYGRVWDGQPEDRIRTLDEDGRIGCLLDEHERVIAAAVRKPFEIDPATVPGIWEEPRFVVPALGPEELSIGEILLLVHARYRPDEPTNDALHFQAGIEAQQEDRELAISMYKLAVEAGDMKGHYSLGYVMCEHGWPREAAEHLKIYTRLTPYNAWAWCWLGEVHIKLGEIAAARAALERALEVEAVSGFETIAAELLKRLD